jgi:hypothetical protein
MSEFYWNELSGDLDEAMKLMEEFCIFTEIKEYDGGWQVWGGESTICLFDTFEEAKAFVLGMALNYVTLPPKVQRLLKSEFDGCQ